MPKRVVPRKARDGQITVATARNRTVYEEHEGNLVGVVDRTGCVWATLAWHGDRLDRLVVPAPRCAAR